MLEPHEAEKLDKIAGFCERIDERTERMDLENDRRFTSAHARIDEVKADLHEEIEDVRGEARRAGSKAGVVTGGSAGILAALCAFFKDWF